MTIKMMIREFILALFFLADIHIPSLLITSNGCQDVISNKFNESHHPKAFSTTANVQDHATPTVNRQHAAYLSYSSNSILLFAEAKGVAGLGKAGGDGTGGADKSGQQVPPEVYNALTYAGTAFLFTLSVPLILYGLNKLLNKIEDCFGCGPSSRIEKNKNKLAAIAASATKTNPLSPNQLQPDRHQLSATFNHPHHQQQQQHQQPQQLQYLESRQLSTSPSNCAMPFSNQQKAPYSSPNSAQLNAMAMINLPFDSQFNHTTPTSVAQTAVPALSPSNTMQQQNFQQPYIISSPHL